jgi:hypothetical protein
MTITIDKELIRYDGHGAIYRVWHNGELLIDKCRIPLFDACRALAKQGKTGAIQMRRKGNSQIDMRTTVEAGTKLDVKDHTEGNPIFVSYSGKIVGM